MIPIVRLVLPHEYAKYRTHLKNLDAESKYLRFGFTATDEIIDRICDKIDNDKSQHILFCVENDDLEFIAIGHIATYSEMELAFSVLKSHQGNKLGQAVMKRCIQYCRTHGLLKGCMVCLSHNKTIQHLCRKNGIQLEFDHGEVLANIELDHPSFATYISEQISSNLGMTDFIVKRTPFL